MPSPKLLLVSLLALTACKQYTMPDYPAGYREFAYIANSAANSVTILDLVYLRQDRTLAVGQNPTALAVNPRLNELYILNTQPEEPTGSVTILDTATNSIAATLPVRRSPAALAIAPDGLRAYVANAGSNTISVLDLKTRRTLATVPTGEDPTALALAPDNRTLVVTNHRSNTIATYTIAASPALTLRNTYQGCPSPTSPVILPDSSKAYIACTASNQVMAIGLALPADSWNAKQDPSLTADHLLTTLDVGHAPTHLTLKPDGGEIFVSNLASDSISELSTLTNEVGSTYSIGNRPTHGIVSADNSTLWVAASGADSISLYSIDDGKFLSSLRTGSAPDALAFSTDQHLLLATDTKSGDVSIFRTTSRFGPALLTILPAAANPTAIAVKAMQSRP